MTAPAYPVRGDGGTDQRFTSALVRDVGLVLERHGYARVSGAARQELESALFEFIYVEREKVMAELEARLNGVHSPHVSPAPLCPEDCLASAHELRRVKDAEGALVIARDSEGGLHIGIAVDEGSDFDELSTEIVGVVDRALERRGWTMPTPHKDVVITVTEGGPKS